METMPDRAVELPFGEAVGTLMAACAIDPGARSAFVARIRHLQRLGLPPRRSPPTDTRLSFGLAELAAIALAFRLMSAFLLPTLAVRYVTERWTELTPALLSGAVEALPAGFGARRPLTGDHYIVLEGAALAELGRKAAHEGRYDGRLGAIALFGENDPAQLSAAAGGAGVILDAAAFMPTLVARLRASSGVTEEDIAHELDRLRHSRAVPFV